MSNISHFVRHAFAGLSAAALTATLLIASFSTGPQMSAVSGLIA